MTQFSIFFGENRYPNNYMNTPLVDKEYEEYILDLVDNACDDYYAELNHGVITLSDLERENVTKEEVQYLVDQGKLKISSVDLENPESIDGGIIYGVQVVHRKKTKPTKKRW